MYRDNTQRTAKFIHALLGKEKYNRVESTSKEIYCLLATCLTCNVKNFSNVILAWHQTQKSMQLLITMPLLLPTWVY